MIDGTTALLSVCGAAYVAQIAGAVSAFERPIDAQVVVPARGYAIKRALVW